MSTLVWFRQDLRLSDNPALVWAAKKGSIAPLFILDPDNPAHTDSASKVSLYHALSRLREALAKQGLTLVLRHGNPLTVLAQAATQTKAESIVWNRLFPAYDRDREQEISDYFEKKEITCRAFNGSFFFAPEEIKTQGGSSFKIFTPFARACHKRAIEPPFPTPKKLTPAASILSDAFDFLPAHPWVSDLEIIDPRKQLKRFLDRGLARYAVDRDYPAKEGTSRLSVALHWGEIGPRELQHALLLKVADDASTQHSADKFFSELLWREFASYLLFHIPSLPNKNIKRSFDAFRWEQNDADFTAWKKGRTGYPFVDAGMRQLRKTGFMHNRLRMVCASFLVKHLLIDWRKGAAWFMETLCDADLANNAASWQWVAGCGTEASPFFRIFNPVLHSSRFDPDGDFIRRFVPELARLKTRYIHAPWTAPDDVLANVGIVLGKTYPRPIIDHAFARQRALARFKEKN